VEEFKIEAILEQVEDTLVQAVSPAKGSKAKKSKKKKRGKKA